MRRAGSDGGDVERAAGFATSGALSRVRVFERVLNAANQPCQARPVIRRAQPLGDKLGLTDCVAAATVRFAGDSHVASSFLVCWRRQRCTSCSGARATHRQCPNRNHGELA
jgi:hypothetical protein